MSAPANRQCSIEIQNKTSMFTLSNPQIHSVSGACQSPLPPTISPLENGSALFTKTAHAACGAVGVFTYDLQQEPTKQNSGRVAVMFSVPYDFNLYSNWYAIGVFGMDKHCDQQLFDEMYKKSEKGFVRGKAKGPSLTYKGGWVTVMATMSDSCQPVLKVQICNN
ncbi:DELTA-sagatoxin-Srs1a-like [Pholidichthys leucotaenia]